MNIKELCAEIAAKHGITEEKIKEAHAFADMIAGQGKDAQKILSEDIPEPHLSQMRRVIEFVLSHKDDPEFTAKFHEMFQRNIAGRN